MNQSSETSNMNSTQLQSFHSTSQFKTDSKGPLSEDEYGIEQLLNRISSVKFAWDSLHTLDVRVSHSGFTPFHLAVVKGNMHVLKYLVRMYRCRDYYRDTFQQGKYQHRKAEYSL